ncbi:MAG: nitroreductase family protein [Bacteroidota bacterium]
MDNIEALQWRYAVKKFDDTSIIPREQVDQLEKAFNLTPTSYGLQPVKLVVIQNKKTQETLMEHSFNQPQIGTASHVLVFCIENKIDENFILDNFERIKKIRNTSDEILAPFRDFLIQDFGRKSPSKIVEWATNQAYLAMGNLLTVCANMKIDSCPMEGFLPNKYIETLQLEEKNITPVLVLPIGIRSENDEFADFAKVRKDINETVIHFNSSFETK